MSENIQRDSYMNEPLVQGRWSEAQIKEFLEKEGATYQALVLPYGHTTRGGNDRSSTANKIFPENMTGKTVLDVGTHEGYFCFEAMRRGAANAVGIDRNLDYLSRAEKFANCFNLTPEFRRLDISVQEVGETFDYVLCLNVLHHLIHPISALDHLVKATKEKLILEVAGMGLHERKKLGLSRLKAMLLKSLPTIYVNPTSRAEGQNWFASPEAIQALLLGQRSHFARVDIEPSPFKNRFLVIGHKRRIDELVLVAGPTSAGKTTLIEKLRRNESPEVARILALGEVSHWTDSGVRHIARSQTIHHEKLLLHFDFLGRLEWSSNGYENTVVDDVIRTAQKLKTLTIWRSPAQLQQQFQANEIDAYKQKNGTEPKRRKHQQLRDDYMSSAKVITYYKRWFDYLRQIPGEHIVADFSGDLTFLSLDEWERKVAH